jgi:predicted acylesterase/phospholipase RssA
MDNVRNVVNFILDELEAFDVNSFTSTFYHFLTLQWVRSEWFEWRNHYLIIAILIIVFWPVIATLLFALAAASTWLFWLLTSLIFGILQLVYVSYQFIMIFSDILILSIFKTYSSLRSRVLHQLGRSGLRRSRRRLWQQAVAAAGSFENFLQIPIESKPSVSKVMHRPWNRFFVRPNKRRNSDDGASSPEKLQIPRNKSFNDAGGHHFNRPNVAMSRYKSFDEVGGRVPKSSVKRLHRNKSLDTASNEREKAGKEQLQNQEEKECWESELGKTGPLLVTTTQRLREVRHQAIGNATGEAAQSLKYLLSGVVKRNHLMLDEILVENSRRIAESGVYGLSQEARVTIRDYYTEVQKGLEWIADSPLDDDPVEQTCGFLRTKQVSEMIAEAEKARQLELDDRLTLVRKMKQNVGRTALMLSGGGAQAMYHLGTIRALLESKLYHDIKVISGTSGGSITAAMCALATPEELYNDVCVPTVSTDYRRNGQMKRENIRWFPTEREMGYYWLKHKLLVDSAEFRSCCDFYFGAATFQEAFQRTGKHVCITVSASRASGGTAQRLLLNHISTPHVTLASAVAASCALPGVMAPAKLMIKDSTGKQEPFEVDGVDWIDGSVQADLPFERISTLFNVSNFVVCQTNFHVVPFLNKAHHPNSRSLYWRLFQTVEWDIRNRALKLSRLGLFPRIFGQDISKVFKQKYHGNLTLVPRFTTMQTFGLKALSNPTVRDMENYLKYGQIAAWPYVNVISDMIRLERALDDCLARLHERKRIISPDWDDVESIASVPSHVERAQKGVRFFGGREAEHLKQRVLSLERENYALKMQIEEMKGQLSNRQEDLMSRTSSVVSMTNSENPCLDFMQPEKS